MNTKLRFQNFIWAVPVLSVIALTFLNSNLRSEYQDMSFQAVELSALNADLAKRLIQSEGETFSGFPASAYWLDGEKASAAQLFQEAVLRQLDRFGLLLSSQREATANPEIELPHASVDFEFEGDLGTVVEFINDLSRHEPPILVGRVRVMRLSDFEQVDGETRIRVAMTVWGLLTAQVKAR